MGVSIGFGIGATKYPAAIDLEDFRSFSELTKVGPAIGLTGHVTYKFTNRFGLSFQFGYTDQFLKISNEDSERYLLVYSTGVKDPAFVFTNLGLKFFF